MVLMNKKIAKIISFLVTVIYLISSTSTSIASSEADHSYIVLPLYSSDIEYNNFITELSDVIRVELNRSNIVIGKDQTNEILNYYLGSIDNFGIKIIGYLDQANDEYFLKGRPSEAIKYLDKAINSLETRNQISEAESDLLLRAKIAKAKISYDIGKKDESHRTISEILRILPTYKLNPKFFSPEYLSFFEAVRSKQKVTNKGTISIKSDPSAVQIFINGLYVGLTPKVITDLSVGKYSLVLNTDHRRPLKRNVYVVKNKKVSLSERLEWIDESNLKGKPLLIGESIEKLINVTTSLASITGVDRVVVIGVDSKRRPFARVIDVQSRQNLKDIKYKSINNIEKQSPRVASYLMRKISKFADKDVFELNKEDVNQAVVLDQRVYTLKRKPIYKRPIFWVGVGFALIGGIVAGVALTAGGSAAATTGSVNLMF